MRPEAEPALLGGLGTAGRGMALGGDLARLLAVCGWWELAGSHQRLVCKPLG